MYNNELQHYGVKGMKWGVRKKTPAEEAGRIIKKIKSKDRMKLATQVVRGSGLRNSYGQKVYQRRLKKEPNLIVGDKPKAYQEQYQKEITRKTRVGLTVRGLADVAGGAVIFSLIGKYAYGLNKKHNTKTVVAISAMIAAVRMSQINSVNVAEKHKARLLRLGELAKSDPEAKKLIDEWRSK